MDIESTSLASMFIANCLILAGVFLYLAFYYKWDNKSYDDLVENVGTRFNKNGGIEGEIFLGEGASNIESLLGKDESSMQYLPGGA